MLGSFVRRFSPTRLVLVVAACACILLIPTYIVLSPSFDSPDVHNALWAPGGVDRDSTRPAAALYKLDDSVLHGNVVMPKLGNATAKAELGRASWKLLHTMAARYPEDPSESDREAFNSFLYVFSRMYPCGECAAEFQQLLRKHPPQTSSRTAASVWLCVVHNEVNERLGKPEFDCSQNLEGLYDCGCGGDGAKADEVNDRAPIQPGERRGKKWETELEGRAATRPRVVKAVVDRDGKRIDPVTGAELVGG